MSNKQNVTSFIPSHHRRIAVVGLAKNVGKTTLLNWVLDELKQVSRLSVGLASIGVDGEAFDVWDLHEKPAITISEGMWIVTAKTALQQSSARFRIVKQLKETSPLGPVYLMQCTTAGNVKLAGTHRQIDIGQTMKEFQARGVHMALVDGAYDRLAAASSEWCDSFILCTGAAVDSNINRAVSKTEEVIMRWQIPVWEEKTHVLSDTVMICQEGEWRSLNSSSLLSSLEQLRLYSSEGLQYVSIPGALTDWVLNHFKHVQKPFAWIVHDPTKIFASSSSLRQWYRQGGDIYVRTKSQLLAVAINPTTFQEVQSMEQWMERIQQVAGDLPVLDGLNRKRLS